MWTRLKSHLTTEQNGTCDCIKGTESDIKTTTKIVCLKPLLSKMRPAREWLKKIFNYIIQDHTTDYKNLITKKVYDMLRKGVKLDFIDTSVATELSEHHDCTRLEIKIDFLTR
jgi:hypothetical protein